MALTPGSDPRVPLPAGDAVTIEIPWAYVEAAIGIGACMVAGAVLGLVVTGARIVAEGRRA